MVKIPPPPYAIKKTFTPIILWLIPIPNNIYMYNIHIILPVLELEPHGSDDAAYLDTVSSCSVLAEYIGTGLAFLCDRKQTNLLRRAAKQRGIKFKFLTR